MTMISKHLIFFIFHKNPVTKIVFLYFKLFVINYTDHERLRKELISDLESIIIMRSNKHFCEVSFKFVCLFVCLLVCLFVCSTREFFTNMESPIPVKGFKV